MTVSLLMTSPVISVTPETMVDEAYKTMAARRISCVPVVTSDGRPVGVLSESDLLRVGRMQPSALAGMLVVELPSEPVRHHMHEGIVTVGPDTSAKAAAEVLAEKRIHRVFVEKDGVIVGVFSTEEVLVALREKRIPTPIEQVMTKPVETVLTTASISEAAARLDHAGYSGVVVVDEHHHPIGVFTKTEALRARNRPTETPVDEVMSYAMLHQNGKTPLYRAAAHAYETGTRRVLVLDGHKLAGVLTGLDFARALARAD